MQVGLLRAALPARWHTTPGEAGTALFQSIDTCLREAGLTLETVAAYAYCEGPGSMLGVRTVAMALRTWQAAQPRPIYHYPSLTLVAHALAGHPETPRPFAVIADARRETWHHVTVDATGRVAALRRTPKIELAAGNEPLWQPSAFRAWAPAPRATRDCAYDVGALFAALPDLDCFTPTTAPDAFQHEAPDYKKWSAHVHQAPAP